MTSDCCNKEIVMGICRRCGEHCGESQDPQKGTLTRKFEQLFRDRWVLNYSDREENGYSQSRRWFIYLEHNGISPFRPRLAHSQMHEGDVVFTWGGKEYYQVHPFDVAYYVPAEFLRKCVILGSLP